MEDIRKDIKQLIVALEENTRITQFLRTELEENTEISKKLHAMLSENNEQTKFLYDQKVVDLTPGQMAKNFGIDLGSNILGNLFTKS